MRLTRWMHGLMLVSAAACSSSVTAPPSGLPATLSAIQPVNGAPSSPTLTAADDSVTAVFVSLANACSLSPTAAAGLSGATLVMTVTSVEKHPGVPCPALVALTVYSMTVRDVPRGTRTAKVVWRSVSGVSAENSVLITSTISLP